MVFYRLLLSVLVMLCGGMCWLSPLLFQNEILENVLRLRAIKIWDFHLTGHTFYILVTAALFLTSKEFYTHFLGWMVACPQCVENVIAPNNRCTGPIMYCLSRFNVHMSKNMWSRWCLLGEAFNIISSCFLREKKFKLEFFVFLFRFLEVLEILFKTPWTLDY